MHRAEHQRGGGAVADELVAEHARGVAGDRFVGEGLLGDVGVVVEPVEQLLALRADDAGLHIVDVGVDKARRDERAGMIEDGSARRQLGP